MALCFPIGSERKLLLAARVREIHDVEQAKKMIPFVTRKSLSLFALHVCKLVVGGNIIDLAPMLTLSNNPSSATPWVLVTCLTVGLRPLIVILMTASLSSKVYN